MSLIWNLTGIKNHKTLCWVRNPEVPESEWTDEKGWKLHPVTDVIIWLTIGVDIGEITDKNVYEFYWRMRFIQEFKKIFMLIGVDSLGRKRKYNPTLKHLKSHIGLKVNVTDKTRAQFMQRMKGDLEYYLDSVLFETKRNKNKILKARIQKDIDSIQEEQILGRMNRTSQPGKVTFIHELPTVEKRKIWTITYSPFIMGGSVYHPITTEVEVIEEREVGKGFKAFSFRTKKGSIRIAESITGAIVGNSFNTVMSDIESASIEVMNNQIKEAEKTLSAGNTVHLSNEVFFTHYRY